MQTYENVLGIMQDKYKELAGFDADSASDIGIRLRVLAYQVHKMLEDLNEVESQVFVQTSTGKYLEMHAQTRGITRKQSIQAKGELRFSRETPASTDIPIAKGILCGTRPDPQIQFETCEAAILTAGQQFVIIPAIAVTSGEIGNVAPASICLMVTPAPGISGVSNLGNFTGGVNDESDDALRERLLRSFSNISNGTNSAFYYDLAMQHSGVSSVNIVPRGRGRGTVDVIIACHNSSSEEQVVAELQMDMSARKEINVDVLVKPAARNITNISAEISVKDGYDSNSVLEICRIEIERHLNLLGVGGSLLMAKLGSVLLQVDGVYNYRIITPVSDIVPLNSSVIQVGDILVKRMAVG